MPTSQALAATPTQEFAADVEAYRQREQLIQAHELITAKRQEKLAAQQAAEAERLAAERKERRVAQVARGELRFSDLSESDYKVVKTIKGRASAYTSSPDECSGDPNITASGMRTRPGIVAASSQYPFGTLLRIPEYDPDMIFVVADRGGAIQGNKLDIWVQTKAEAYAWGVRGITIEIVEVQ